MRKSILQSLVLSLATMPLLSMDADADVVHHAGQTVTHVQPSPVPSRPLLTLDELKALANSEEMRKARAVKEQYMKKHYPRTQEEIRNNGHFRPY